MAFASSSSFRSNLRTLCLLNGTIILFILSRIFDLTTQLNDAALMKWAVTRKELETPGLSIDSHGDFGGSSAPNSQIPKIIHQTYRTADIPAQWREVQVTIKYTNPDYKYVLWTDESAREFLAKNYPWFLKTFDNYKYPIMRADALRYFVLYHYGGFYVDLDIGIKTSLEPLRNLSSFFYKTSPTGVSNDIMGCIPGHHFMGFVIRNLQKYNCNYLIPYLTVMYSTGPLFLSVVLQKYNLWKTHVGNEATRIFVLRDTPDSIWKPLADYIFHVDGSTWHRGDAPFFTMVSKHLSSSITLITVSIVAAITLLFYVELKIVKLVNRVIFRRRRSQLPNITHMRLKEA